jgi:Zn-finger protein
MENKRSLHPCKCVCVCSFYFCSFTDLRKKGKGREGEKVRKAQEFIGLLDDKNANTSNSLNTIPVTNELEASNMLMKISHEENRKTLHWLRV